MNQISSLRRGFWFRITALLSSIIFPTVINGNPWNNNDSSEVQKSQLRPLIFLSYTYRSPNDKTVHSWMPAEFNKTAVINNYENSSAHKISIGARWKSGWITGLVYENYNQTGRSMQVEETDTVVYMFWYLITVYGDELIVEQNIHASGIFGGYELKKVPLKHFVGTSIKVLGTLEYITVDEKRTLHMDGGGVETFVNKQRHSIISGQIGLRFDLQISKFFSLILPEVGYEFEIFSQTVPAVSYQSSFDQDIYSLEKKKYNISTFRFMIGANIQF